MSVASLTGSLMARKGDARPSFVNGFASYPGRQPETLYARACEHADAGGREVETANAGGEALRRDRHGRARVSLRLDPERHRRLRLASAHRDESIQELLTRALDVYLENFDLDCPCVREGAHACERRCSDGEGPR